MTPVNGDNGQPLSSPIKMVVGSLTLGSKGTLVTLLSGFTGNNTYTVTVTSRQATVTGNQATVRIISATQFEVFGSNGDVLNYTAIGY